jgi:hypothetical protein
MCAAIGVVRQKMREAKRKRRTRVRLTPQKSAFQSITMCSAIGIVRRKMAAPEAPVRPELSAAAVS